MKAETRHHLIESWSGPHSRAIMSSWCLPIIPHWKLFYFERYCTLYIFLSSYLAEFHKPWFFRALLRNCKERPHVNPQHMRQGWWKSYCCTEKRMFLSQKKPQYPSAFFLISFLQVWWQKDLRDSCKLGRLWRPLSQHLQICWSALRLLPKWWRSARFQRRVDEKTASLASRRDTLEHRPRWWRPDRPQHWNSNWNWWRRWWWRFAKKETSNPHRKPSWRRNWGSVLKEAEETHSCGNWGHRRRPQPQIRIRAEDSNNHTKTCANHNYHQAIYRAKQWLCAKWDHWEWIGWPVIVFLQFWR